MRWKMKNYYEIRGDITEIHLKRYGLITTIDTEDLEMVLSLGNINWTINLDIKKGARSVYVIGTINKKVYRLHRVLTNCPEGMVPDHINHDTIDNRKCNLQVITNAENIRKRSYVSQNWHNELNKQLEQEKIVLVREKDIKMNVVNRNVTSNAKVKVSVVRKWNEQKDKFERVKQYKIN
jgi:hypothetical protein